MKTLLFIFTSLCFCSTTFAQSLPTGPYVLPIGANVCDDLLFFYDAGGNRILRIEVYCGATNPKGGIGGGAKTDALPIPKENIPKEYEIVMSKIAPNPTQGLLNLTFDKPIESADILLTDAKGTILLQKKVYDQSQILDISTYPIGTYHIRVAVKDMEYRQVVVKE